MIIVLFYPKSDDILEVEQDKVIDDMYEQLAMIPTIDQLKKYKNIKTILEKATDKTIEEYIKQEKEIISRLTYKLPLFDYNTKNLYLVDENNIYNKVTLFNYRFPDASIIELLQSTIVELKKSKLKDNVWVEDYIKKLTKNINFLTNFNLTILKETFVEIFLNTNPTSKELTTCIKPSYLPSQNYQSPYYSKSELVNLGLNLGIIKETNKKPWQYKKKEIADLCREVSKYEINTQLIIYNQLYILYNNAKAYVQFYSLFGSYYFNNYLRNNKSIYDNDLNKHIDNFLKIIKNTPSFDQEYELYRFIEDDEYLSQIKVGDIYEENSFISTTRNPFYSVNENVFGFNLVKIKLKKNKPGIALLMESYSNYPHEQEVLLPPSRLKLVEINEDFKYYHMNKLAEKKIKKKYVFEYIEPLSYDVDYYVKEYKIDSVTIPHIDFYTQNFEGDSVSEKTLYFFNSLPKINLRRIFTSTIGKTEYKFYAYFLTQNKVYSKFFFLQKENDQNKLLGDEIYLTIQNPLNGQIDLLIEIRNIISVNYYHRYSGLSTTIEDNILVHWLSGLAKSLGISTVIIHGNYMSYANVVENILNKKGIKEKNLLENFKMIQDIDNPDSNILNLYTADINTYCIDLIDYIFDDKKRFNNKLYIERKIPLHMIDNLKKIKFVDLYNKYGVNLTGYEYLYKICNKIDPTISVNSLYKILHLSYPYLVSKLQNLVILSYPKTSYMPWHFYYILKPYEYLYENKLIPYIPVMSTAKIENLIKNLETEVEFIHKNKFRQIYVPQY